MRVVICWTGVSGYLTACWRALAARPCVDLRVFFCPGAGNANAPFRADVTDGVPGEALTPEQYADAAYVAQRVLAHQPDIVVIPGWATPAYNALAFNPALANARLIMAMDTPRKHDARGLLRQWVGRVKLRRYLRRMDRVIVPGERSWQYARFIGFDESQIRRGNYGFDYELFRPLLERRLARDGGWPRRFLFAGRYVEAKGIDVLLEAYAAYRRQHGGDAWPLTCSGTGPMADRVRAAEGVEDLGFVQPQDQPALWANCGAFVLASRYEPWGVALAEACAAGLPILCTEECGASVELVRPQYNGLTVATGDAKDLARGLAALHAAYDRLPEMGRRGQPLAAAYSAEAFADRWAAMFAELHEAP